MRGFFESAGNRDTMDTEMREWGAFDVLDEECSMPCQVMKPVGVALLVSFVLFAPLCAGVPYHGADVDHDAAIAVPELLRVIQLYRGGAYACDAATADGYTPGAGNQGCTPHSGDYAPRDWRFSLSEVVRVVQLMNAGSYHPDARTEDGFAPGALQEGDLPTARFTASSVTGIAPLEVVFTDTSLPGNAPITAWRWDFGDGKSSDAQDPAHTYKNPGEYTVTLTVTNALGTDSHSFSPVTVYSPVPLFSVGGGTFTTGFNLTLGGVSPDAEIRFTADGSIPDASSSLYSGPLFVSRTLAVSARVFPPGQEPGPVATEVYVQVDAGLADFDSNLPLVVVDSLGYDFSRDDNVTGDYPYEEVYSVFLDTADTGRASILGATDWAGRAGMHVRGASSATYPKKQYKFEVWDENHDDKNASLLGMPRESDWILNAPYFDKTLMRNHLVYRWWERLGYWSPRTKLIEVFINMDGGAVTMDDYVGVYVLTESVKRDGDRVDIQAPDPAALAAPEITGGYILQTTNILQHFTTNTGVFFKFEEPKVSDDLPLHKAWIEQYLDDFEATLYGPDFTDPVTGYRHYIDVPSHIDYDIMRELTRNIDGASTYFSKDRNGPITMGPLWDYNQSLGMTSLFNDEHGWETDGWNRVYMDELGHWAKWWGRLDDDPDYQLAWEDRWTALRKDKLSSERLLGDIDATAALLEEGQQRNYTRWPVLGQSVWQTPDPREAPGFEERDTYAKEVQWMRDWLEARLNWIDAQILPAPVFSRDGGTIAPGFQLTMTNPWGRGDLYYTLDGTDPRVPRYDTPPDGITGSPGGVSSAAARYTGPVVLNETVRVRARALSGGRWTPLAEAVFAVQTVGDALRVTEIMYHPPDAPDGNPLAEFVEVMNVSDHVVNPRFTRFTDGIRYEFPDSPLAPGERVVIVADETAFAAVYGGLPNVIGTYEGRLNNGGERLVLEDAAGAIIQDFHFDDAWYPETDGGGYSLTVMDPAQSPDKWSLAEGWRTSLIRGGTPGVDEE